MLSSQPSRIVRLPRYRILGLVGRGQFGRVFCARSRESGHLVALKELEPQRFPTSNFLRELRFLLTLQHENIVSCLSLEHHRGNRYLVMEYCEAGTLRDLLERSNSLTLDQIFRLIFDVLRGLARAHAENIIHCDIKPENVLLKLTRDGWQGKLSDFGIARLGQEASGDRSHTGSPGYMAPERFYGQFGIGSDIYAVGVLLYELLCGRRPFTGPPSELAIAHLNQRVSFPPTLPAALRAVLAKALEKLPGRRYASAERMAAALAEIATDPEVVAFGNSPRLLEGEPPPPPTVCVPLPAETAIALAQPALAIAPAADNRVWVALGATVQQRSVPDLAWQTEIALGGTVGGLSAVAGGVFALAADGLQAIAEQTSRMLAPSLPAGTHWAAAPHGRWFALGCGSAFELRDRITGNRYKLRFSGQTIRSTIALDRHHVAVFTTKNETEDSRIYVISRRGHQLWKFSLPATVVQAIGLSPPLRVLAVEQHPSPALLAIDLNPYRLHRIPLRHLPDRILATAWGWAIATEEAQGQSRLELCDAQGTPLGSLALEGKITAMASPSARWLVVGTTRGTAGTPNARYFLWTIDLKTLAVEVIL